MIYDKIENSEDIPKLCKENEKTNKIIIKANKAKGQKKEEKMEQQIKFFLISDLIFNEKNQKCQKKKLQLMLKNWIFLKIK